MLKIIKRDFPREQYFPTAVEKTQIVLHHTVSSNPESSITYWRTTKERVAVAYIIDKQGTVFQIYNERHWAYHLGAGTNAADNMRSIGIEIVNEGPVWPAGDNGFTWLDQKAPYHGGVHVPEVPFRGFRHFASYTDEQVIATGELCEMLCKQFNIKRDVVTSLQYDKKLLFHNGIICHHNVRPDKSDVHPGFDFTLMKSMMRNE